MQNDARARLIDNRWINDATGAAFITLLVFSGLHLATTGHRQPATNDRPLLITDFTYIPKPQPPPATPRKPEPPKKLEQPQPTRMSVSAPARPAELAASAAGIPAPTGKFGVIPFGPVNIGEGAGGDGELIPLVAIAPQYPSAAARDGIEGWVDVEIVIGPDGMVRSARAIGARPRGVFESAAVQAAFKSRFRARTVDGQGVEARGVRRYNFNLGEN